MKYRNPPHRIRTQNIESHHRLALNLLSDWIYCSYYLYCYLHDCLWYAWTCCCTCWRCNRLIIKKWSLLANKYAIFYGHNLYLHICWGIRGERITYVEVYVACLYPMNNFPHNMKPWTIHWTLFNYAPFINGKDDTFSSPVQTHLYHHEFPTIIMFISIKLYQTCRRTILWSWLPKLKLPRMT